MKSRDQVMWTFLAILINFICLLGAYAIVDSCLSDILFLDKEGLFCSEKKGSNIIRLNLSSLERLTLERVLWLY